MNRLTAKTKKLTLLTAFTQSFSVFIFFMLTSCGQPQYPLLDGDSITIPNHKGWVLVNFWAPWCTPCIEEIPELNRLALELPEPLVAVVGVYFDPISSAKLKSQVKKFNIHFKIISIDSPTLPVPSPNMLPANYLVSPAGHIHGPLLGPQTQKSILEAISTYKNSKL